MRHQQKGLCLVLSGLDLFLLFGPKLPPARENQINTGLPKSNRQLRSQSRKDQVAFQIEAIITLQKTEYKSLTMWVKQSGIKKFLNTVKQSFPALLEITLPAWNIFKAACLFSTQSNLLLNIYMAFHSSKCPTIINYSALLLVT